MAKKKKDFSKEILERIVGTKKKTDLAEKFKEVFEALYNSAESNTDRLKEKIFPM